MIGLKTTSRPSDVAIHIIKVYMQITFPSIMASQPKILNLETPLISEFVIQVDNRLRRDRRSGALAKLETTPTGERSYPGSVLCVTRPGKPDVRIDYG